MSNSRRLLIVAVAVVAAVASLILLKPSDEGSDEPARQAPAPSTQETGATGSTQAASKPRDRSVPTVRLQNGKVVGDPLQIRVANGDRIRFKVLSDLPDEIHVHGFDLQKSTAPGDPASFSFVADIEGAYEAESHHSGALVAEIQVRPRR